MFPFKDPHESLNDHFVLGSEDRRKVICEGLACRLVEDWPVFLELAEDGDIRP